MASLVLAEHDNRRLRPSTLNVVAAAGRMGGEVHVLVAGGDCAEVARQAAQVAGVAKVRVADAPHLAEELAECVSEQVVALATGYSHVLAAATSFGKDVLPRAAARHDCALVSDIVAIESPDTFARPIYAGNAIATGVERRDDLRAQLARFLQDRVDRIIRGFLEARQLLQLAQAGQFRQYKAHLAQRSLVQAHHPSSCSSCGSASNRSATSP